MPRHPNAGRRVGSKNKKTILRVKEVLAEKNINPAEKILEIIGFLEPSEQLKAWGLLLSYCEPKPSEIEEPVKPTSDEVIEQLRDVSDEKLIAAIEKKENVDGDT